MLDLLPVPGWSAGRGRPPGGYGHRQMIDMVRYSVDNGIKWRAMSSDFPLHGADPTAASATPRRRPRPALPPRLGPPDTARVRSPAT
ncbi:hypothetical protein [Streptomyces dioscori]|uniref:hypothetical protein n=1 Tax=Streptomyces dioscori TaxID=2109333 RepID=UPI00384D298B